MGSLSGITAVAAGANHALALTGSGTVMAWGDDNLGELGNGDRKRLEETPVEVSGLTGVQAISAGSQDSAALLGNGTLMTWGINKFGTLGDGTSGEPSDVPVTVNGISKVASVSAGGTQMLAYGEPIPTVTGVSPNVGPTTGGTTGDDHRRQPRGRDVGEVRGERGDARERHLHEPRSDGACGHGHGRHHGDDAGGHEHPRERRPLHLRGRARDHQTVTSSRAPARAARR